MQERIVLSVAGFSTVPVRFVASGVVLFDWDVGKLSLHSRVDVLSQLFRGWNPVAYFLAHLLSLIHI